VIYQGKIVKRFEDTGKKRKDIFAWPDRKTRFEKIENHKKGL